MPLEDLGGNKYIDSLNPAWPVGTDSPSAGDDHIRGVKNVLKKTFPNLTGPVTATQDALNSFAIPSGTRMLFYQPNAPSGWVRVSGINNTYALRVVASSSTGGGTGGADDPVVNDKVPSHTHPMSGATASANASHTHSGSGTTGSQSANHTHTGTTNADGSHTHGINDTGELLGFGLASYDILNGVPPASSPGNFGKMGDVRIATVAAHSHQFTTGNDSIAHTHTFNFTTNAATDTHSHSFSSNTDANAAAASWRPRYLDVIIAERI
jgi:hypothetical protein